MIAMNSVSDNYRHSLPLFFRWKFPLPCSALIMRECRRKTYPKDGGRQTLVHSRGYCLLWVPSSHRGASNFLECPPSFKRFRCSLLGFHSPRRWKARVSNPEKVSWIDTISTSFDLLIPLSFCEALRQFINAFKCLHIHSRDAFESRRFLGGKLLSRKIKAHKSLRLIITAIAQFICSEWGGKKRQGGDEE